MDYDRQAKFLGQENQKKLEEAKVLIVGCGGLGSQAANILACSGVNLVLVDDDLVEETNLHRTVFRKKDVGRPKVKALKKILERCSNVEIEIQEEKFREENGGKLIEDVDVAIDCLDNMKSRLVLNKICLETETPLVHGAVLGNKGRCMTFTYEEDEPCLQCLYQDKGQMESTETRGVLSPVVNLIASIEASETIKLITKTGEVDEDLLIFDLNKNKARKITVIKNKRCKACF